MSEALYAEVRVHGVSATPPETMLASPELQSPTAVRAAGDSLAGFYRREFQVVGAWDRSRRSPGAGAVEFAGDTLSLPLDVAYDTQELATNMVNGAQSGDTQKEGVAIVCHIASQA
jgi:hypothetical protein